MNIKDELIRYAKWYDRATMPEDAQTDEADLVQNIESYLQTEGKNIVLSDVSGSGGVIRTERGWAGHFICSNRCKFRRNTLLAYNDIKIVVSSVGLMEIDGKFETIGHNRHFETMVFHSDPTDKKYYDANVSKQVSFDSEWAIAETDADDKANEMHEAVVAEIMDKLLKGEKFDTKDEW